MKRASFTFPIIFFITTFVLLVLPGNEFPKTGFFSIKGLDKIVHTVMFFILNWLFYGPFKASDKPIGEKQKWFLTISILAVVYGALMEVVQLYFVPFRSFELADILVDALGAFLAYFFARRKLNLVKKSRPR